MSSHVTEVYKLDHPYIPPVDGAAGLLWNGRSLPETPWELGFVRTDTPIKLAIYNGESTAINFTGVVLTDAEGITVDSHPDVGFPVVIQPHTTEWVEVIVGLEGPTQFDSYLTFQTTNSDMVLRIVGIRAPFLSGNIATLLWPHNWENGLQENLEWKTEILTSYGGIEQRIGLIPLPRRSFSLSYLVQGEDTSLLSTYLSARRTDFFYIPTWSDLGRLTAPALKGDSVLYLDADGRDYVQDQKVVVWSSLDVNDQISIIGGDASSVTLSSSLQNDYPVGTLVAPLKPYYLQGQVGISKHSSKVTSFTCNMASVYDNGRNPPYEPTIYGTYEIMPLPINYITTGETVGHKWELLDNYISLPVIIRESIEPIYSVPVEVVTNGRVESDTFYSFLHQIRGRALPFWVDSKTQDMYPTSGFVLGGNEFLIQYSAYASVSLGEPGKSHIRVNYKDGTNEIYDIIGSTFNPAEPTVETVQVSPNFPADRDVSEIADIRYIQLVRMASDKISINWEAVDKFRCSFSIRVLVQ